MAKRKKPGEELERAERAQPIVALRREGLSFREIADVTGISKSTAQRRYKDTMARSPAITEIKEHKTKLFVDLELVIENLRPSVHCDEHPHRRDMDRFLRAINQKMRVLGLFDPPPVQAARHPNANGHADGQATHDEPAAPSGHNMWSRVLECPRED